MIEKAVGGREPTVGPNGRLVQVDHPIADVLYHAELEIPAHLEALVVKEVLKTSLIKTKFSF